MKKHFLVVLFGAMAFTQATAQKKGEPLIKPSNEAKAAFEKKFPGVSKAKWEKEGADLEVNFEKNGKEMSAVFGLDGKWKETETEISVKDLPAAALSYLQKTYAGQKIAEAAKIDKEDGSTNYEAEVGKKDVLFDANGKFLK